MSRSVAGCTASGTRGRAAARASAEVIRWRGESEVERQELLRSQFGAIPFAGATRENLDRALAAGEHQPGGPWWEQATCGTEGAQVLVASLLAEHRPNLSPGELYVLAGQLLEGNPWGTFNALLLLVATKYLRDTLRVFGDEPAAAPSVSVG